MRWRFADPRNPDEQARRARLLEAIDAWWAAFARDVGAIDASFSPGARGAFDLPAFMRRHLGAVDSRICWEYGPALGKTGHRLIFTPEADRHLHPLVGTLVERAPSLARWEFYVYRRAEAPDAARAYVEALSKQGRDYPDAEARLSRGAHGRIDVTISASDFASDDDQDARAAALRFCEALLGEEDLDRWVGAIDVEPAADRHSLPLERLRPTFEALKGSIRDQLPDRPLHELDLVRTAEWRGYRRDRRPEESDDPAGRDGIYVGSTARVDIMQAAIAPAFCGLRFSRCDETFCYLKLDWSSVDRKGVVAWRGAFEDALEPALRRERCGCIYGSAGGERYMYIDLALTDVDRAIEVLRATLRPLSAPRRSWLLFFEPEYGQEWVGVWDDSPPPPAREDGSVG